MARVFASLGPFATRGARVIGMASGMSLVPLVSANGRRAASLTVTARALSTGAMGGGGGSGYGQGMGARGPGVGDPRQQQGHAGGEGQGPPQGKPVETVYLTRGNIQSIMSQPMPLLLVAASQEVDAAPGTDLIYKKSMRFLEAAKGQVPLVKLDAGTFPEAQQSLQIHSLPAVYFISQGRVIDRVGGSGEDIKPAMLTEYFERLAKMLGIELPSAIGETLSDAAYALDVEKDVNTAAQLFQSVVNNNESSKDNLMSAGAGLCRVELAMGELDNARGMMATLEADHPASSALDLRHARALLRCYNDTNTPEIDEGVRTVCAKTVEGDHEGAIAAALKLLRKSKTDETKELVLRIIDAAGPKTDVAKKGRKRFSSALFI